MCKRQLRVSYSYDMWQRVMVHKIILEFARDITSCCELYPLEHEDRR